MPRLVDGCFDILLYCSLAQIHRRIRPLPALGRRIDHLLFFHWQERFFPISFRPWNPDRSRQLQRRSELRCWQELRWHEHIWEELYRQQHQLGPSEEQYHAERGRICKLPGVDASEPCLNTSSSTSAKTLCAAGRTWAIFTISSNT